ncbi:hypothetical protein ACFLRP_02095 [Bacteroidota bacterium]
MAAKTRAKKMLPAIKFLINELAIEQREKSREILADELIDSIKRLFPKEKPPRWETVIKMISYARNHEVAPVDKPWSVASCELPYQAIGRVVAIQRMLLGYGRYLTIRRAKWTAKLTPFIPNADDLTLLQIASFYSRREQIAEIAGDDYPDTTDLDYIFIINGDISFETILRQWLNVYLPGIIDDLKDKNTDPGPNIKDTLELTVQQKTLLSEFTNLLFSGEWDAIRDFILKHPDIRPIAQEWLVLSVRKDIANQILENKGD